MVRRRTMSTLGRDNLLLSDVQRLGQNRVRHRRGFGLVLPRALYTSMILMIAQRSINGLHFNVAATIFFSAQHFRFIWHVLSFDARVSNPLLFAILRQFNLCREVMISSVPDPAAATKNLNKNRLLVTLSLALPAWRRTNGTGMVRKPAR